METLLRATRETHKCVRESAVGDSYLFVCLFLESHASALFEFF